MHRLVTQSIAIIEAGQAANGAYVACPTFPTYNYSWFRDSTFIAYALDQWEQHASAERFYHWAAQNVIARREAVERCVEAAAEGRVPDPADLLDTRYTLDGQTGEEEWPNFQLDGFGTLLWGLRRHISITKRDTIEQEWAEAASILIHYLTALWRLPNFDCWEEFPNNIAVSTLAALYAGLNAATTLPGLSQSDSALAEKTAAQIKAFVLSNGARDGHLIKQIDGEDVVDASLLWACVPFDGYGLFTPDSPHMRATAQRVEQDLIGGTGGVHRYLADTYYGGGEWMLLTALLGEYRAASGDYQGAQQCLQNIEQHFTEVGLPEQIADAALHPERVQEWIERWGPSAQPLLWSHATYLSLYHRLHNSKQ